MKNNLSKASSVVLIGFFLVALNSYAAEQAKMKSQSPAPAHKINKASAQQKANQASPGQLKQKTLLGTTQPDKANKVITQKYAGVVKKMSGYIQKVDFGFMKFSNKTIKAKPVDNEDSKGKCLEIAVDCWIKLANDSATLDVLEKGVNDCAVKEKDGCDDYPLCDSKEQKLAGIILWSDPADIPNKQKLEWGIHCEKKDGAFHAVAKCLDPTYPYSEHIEYYDGFAPQIYGCKDGEWWGLNMSFGLHGSYGKLMQAPEKGLVGSGGGGGSVATEKTNCCMSSGGWLGCTDEESGLSYGVGTKGKEIFGLYQAVYPGPEGKLFEGIFPTVYVNHLEPKDIKCGVDFTMTLKSEQEQKDTLNEMCRNWTDLPKLNDLLNELIFSSGNDNKIPEEEIAQQIATAFPICEGYLPCEGKEQQLFTVDVNYPEGGMVHWHGENGDDIDLKLFCEKENNKYYVAAKCVNAGFGHEFVYSNKIKPEIVVCSGEKFKKVDLSMYLSMSTVDNSPICCFKTTSKSFCTTPEDPEVDDLVTSQNKTGESVPISGSGLPKLKIQKLDATGEGFKECYKLCHKWESEGGCYMPFGPKSWEKQEECMKKCNAKCIKKNVDKCEAYIVDF